MPSKCALTLVEVIKRAFGFRYSIGDQYAVVDIEAGKQQEIPAARPGKHATCCESDYRNSEVVSSFPEEYRPHHTVVTTDADHAAVKKPLDGRCEERTPETRFISIFSGLRYSPKK